MTRLKPVTAKYLCKKLTQLGFEMVRQKGSHSFWRHPDGRCTVIPMHKGENIGKGLFRSILNDLQLEIDDLV